MTLCPDRSFHEGMHAVVRIGTTTTTDNTEVLNGPIQGCTLALTLFSIYFSAMVGNWRAGCPQAGVSVKFKHGRKPVGDHTAKSQLDEVHVTESQYANDAAMYMYVTSCDAFEQATRVFVQSASKWVLTVNTGKTKGLVDGQHLEESDVGEVQLEGGAV